MSRPVSIGRLISLAAALAFLGSVWFFFAPSQLGGRTNYVFTDGVSMLPDFRTGDLAVVRSRSSYHVGEVVAYHNRMLGTIVLHRIVAIHGDRYVFKGDNNNFLDTERPTRGRLIGALWIHLPQAEGYLSTLRSPLGVSVLAAVSVLLLLGGAATRRQRRRRSADDRREPPSTSPPPRPAHAGGHDLLDATAATVAPAAAFALAAFLVLGIVGYGRPTIGRISTVVPYRQSGTFSYWAHVRPSVAYPTGALHTGDPIFMRLVRSLRVGFTYKLSSKQRVRASGTIGLSAKIASGNGWSRTFALSPPHPFSGRTAVATGTLDIGSLPGLLAQLQDTTDITDVYTVSLLASVAAGGTVASVPVHTTFAPTLGFSFDPSILQVQSGAGAPTSSYGQSKDGSVLRSHLGPATLSLHGVRARIQTVRHVALVGVVGSCALLALSGLTLLLHRRGRDESARIRARYGPWIVPVSRLPGDVNGEVLQVADVESLAKLAERYDRPILHEPGPDGRGGYAVTDGGIRYVYRSPAAETPEPSAEASADGDASEGPVTAAWLMSRLGLRVNDPPESA
jgi:signal peptidase I